MILGIKLIMYIYIYIYIYYIVFLTNAYLVGGLEHVLFFHILGIILPTD